MFVPTADVRTLFLVVAILYLLMPAYAWLSLRAARTRAVAYWCLGGLSIGIGTLAAAIGGPAPSVLTFQTLTCLIALSHILRIRALQLDLGRPWPWYWLPLVALAQVVIVSVLRFGQGQVVLSAQISNLISALHFLYIAYLAWQISVAEKSRSAHWIAGVYVLLALAFLWRALVLPTVGGGGAIMVNQTPSSIIAFAGLLSAVIGHFGYVGLCLERSLRNELDTVASSARRHEEDRLAAHFNHLEKKHRMGELSATLAHELSQPLTAILTNAQIVQMGLRKAPSDTAFLAGLLEKIARSTERAHKILQGMRASIALPAASQDVVDLNQVVREVVDLLEQPLRAQGVALQLNLSESPARVQIDALQASQVVLNLFQNAIDALSGAQQRNLSVCTMLQEGRVRLRLQDTGGGLSDSALRSAGQAFFTTKRNGFGLGLSISRSIVAQFRGSLRLTNSDTVRSDLYNAGSRAEAAQLPRGAVAELDFPLHRVELA